MRAIRGGDIGLVFQEPMSSLSAFHTIGNQLIEGFRLHRAPVKRARGATHRPAGDGESPARRSGSMPIRVRIVGRLRQRVMIALGARPPSTHPDRRRATTAL